MFSNSSSDSEIQLQSNYHTPKAKWSREEDSKLFKIVMEQGPSNWPKIAALLPGRNGKQCRERWLTNLSPDVNLSPWSQNEDDKLVELHKSYGNKWALMSHQFQGRTPIAIKNRWKWLQKRMKSSMSESSRTFIKSPPQVLCTEIQFDAPFQVFGSFEEYVEF